MILFEREKIFDFSLLESQRNVIRVISLLVVKHRHHSFAGHWFPAVFLFQLSSAVKVIRLAARKLVFRLRGIRRNRSMG